MATTDTTWHPSDEEVRRIVVELRPVIDECVRRSEELLAGAEAEADQVRGGVPVATRLLSA